MSHGNGVLGQIFGSKEVSRSVAQNAASQSGLDPSLLQKMLPMLVAGHMAKQSEAGAPVPAGGGLGGLLGGLLGAKDGSGASSNAGTTGLGSMLDLNGDGNPLDDILRLVGKGLR